MSAAEQNSPTIRIYGVVFSVGIACSLAIVSVFELTRPIIAANQVAFRESAILEVLPGTTKTATFRFDPATEQFALAASESGAGEVVFAGFNADGQLVGLAIEASGMGYQDRIRLLYGYSPADEAIIGICVLESRETPGLGDRVETDEAYLGNFERLDVGLVEDGTALKHSIEFVKPGAKVDRWQVDGITGATITSRAIADILSDSTAVWIPRVQRRLQNFESEPTALNAGAALELQPEPAASTIGSSVSAGASPAEILGAQEDS